VSFLSGQMLEEVFYKGDQFVIERAGRPMAAVVPVWQLAAVVPVWQLEEWQKLHDREKPNPGPGKHRRKQGKV
jgi:hypothetical protein